MDHGDNGQAVVVVYAGVTKDMVYDEGGNASCNYDASQRVNAVGYKVREEKDQ
jgi:hypothetical protein